MTKQTFDPHGSLDLPDMLDQAKLKLVWHPFWKSIKGTPLENDLPVLMVELVHEYLKRQNPPAAGQPVELLQHLRNVLYMLAGLHPDDQCTAYEEALSYYNAICPNQQIAATEGFTLRLRQPEREAITQDEIAEVLEVENICWNEDAERAAAMLLERFELRRRG